MRVRIFVNHVIPKRRKNSVDISWGLALIIPPLRSVSTFLFLQGIYLFWKTLSFINPQYTSLRKLNNAIYGKKLVLTKGKKCGIINCLYIVGTFGTISFQARQRERQQGESAARHDEKAVPPERKFEYQWVKNSGGTVREQFCASPRKDDSPRGEFFCFYLLRFSESRR